MSIVTIRYQAEVEWFDPGADRGRRELCDVVHRIEYSTMETADLDWEPIAERKTT